MIKIENTEVLGFDAAIRGMRNPMNSWDRKDSGKQLNDQHLMEYEVGPNDHDLMMRLASAGPVHAKYRRMIVVYVDITAPLYWLKEFDTYKVGTVANSCSTMHKIHAKEFELDDFSHEHILKGFAGYDIGIQYNSEYDDSPEDVLEYIVYVLNKCREKYLETNDKKYWWQMIQLLPSSYNQKRTVMLNYEVLANMYESRKDHKLDEWRTFCKWIESLPYSEIITGDNNYVLGRNKTK